MIFYDVNPCDVAAVRLCGSQCNDIYHIGIFLLHGHYLLQVVTELRKEMLLCVVRCCPGIASHFIYFPVGEMRNGYTVRSNRERQIGCCIGLCAFGQGYDLFDSCLGRCESDRILRKLVCTRQNPATLCFKDNVEALFVCNFNICDASSGIVFLIHNHHCIRVRNQSADMLYHGFQEFWTLGQCPGHTKSDVVFFITEKLKNTMYLSAIRFKCCHWHLLFPRRE